MEDPEEILASAESRLLEAYKKFQSPHSDQRAAEFYALALQMEVFYFDVVRYIYVICVTNPSGLALSMSLRDLVHKMYEYDVALNAKLVRRITSLAQTRGLELDLACLKLKRKEWKSQFSKLREWSEVRNHAAGHYGNDIGLQISLIDELRPMEVLRVSEALIDFNSLVRDMLAKVGKARDQAAA